MILFKGALGLDAYAKVYVEPLVVVKKLKWPDLGLR